MSRSVVIILLVTACSQPRSADYFAAHRKEAESVIAACAAGAHRGRECETAHAGIASAKRDQRMKLYRRSF
ncbi:MAG: hypothetical protein BGN86_06450 [Caulobacterales bacterium 68-7]|nr:EexN family lipoprotein [Caulobacterales bacterium]OJU12791.1 MAG: hypothetical protein BGN86_06450 [Caulobacterales bacterium 68-7]